MSVLKPTLVIMAAGMGSRFGGLKQVEGLGPYGETLMEYAIFDAIKAGFGKIVFVIRKNMESVFLEVFNEKLLQHIPFELVFQELDDLPHNFQKPENRIKPWGTAHAIWSCRKTVQSPFALINGDDFYGRAAYQNIAGFFDQHSDPHLYALNAYQLEKTLSDFGGVNRGICQLDAKSQLIKVDEQLQLARNADGMVRSMLDNKTVEFDPKSPVSMNIWAFYPTVFQPFEKLLIDFLNKNLTDSQSEAFVPAFITALIEQQKVSVKVLTSHAQWFGITYPQDKILAKVKLQKMTDQGLYPSPLF